jgi:hypothetical protein
MARRRAAGAGSSWIEIMARCVAIDRRDQQGGATSEAAASRPTRPLPRARPLHP